MKRPWKPIWQEKETGTGGLESSMRGGCPSTRIQTLIPIESLTPAEPNKREEDGASVLTHWPVQIRLVPANAPFLKGADLLVLADCSAVAFANLHERLLKDKVVMMGCPKFDDAQAYIEKFSDIFRTAGIRRVTIVFMEVPCCSGLPLIVKKALQAAGKAVPVEEIKISTRGKVVEKEKVA